MSLEDDGACLTYEFGGELLSHLAMSDSIMAVTTLSGTCVITELAQKLE